MGRNMQIENTVEMAGSLDTIVQLAADVERWPVILPHYRWVTLLDGGDDHKVVEMAARRGRIPVRWHARQDVDRSGATPVIRYRHIWGITKGMEVVWIFTPGPRSIAVRIDHDFSPTWPVVGGPIANHVIGPHFVGAIANKTLEMIKAIAEDRDPRFGTDGQPRS
jgi:ribosome-associated toxin RatA of RatAB toxin-antitoxin module